MENRGQWDARARYAAPVAPGARLFVEATGFTYALTAGLPDHGPHPEPSAGTAAGLLKGHALRVEFVQPGPEARLTAPGAPVPGQRHYLRGADAAQWAQGVPAWPQLRYQELWPGIDLTLKESAGGQLEYDLLLAAGADARRACFRYQGATTLTLDANGRLQATTTAGQLTEQPPRAWQTNPATGESRPVACAFVLRGTTVAFKLGKYDHHLPLVIDPVVQFASYTGSAVENWGFAATHDAAGNLYTAGVVFEPGYPVTTGSYQTTFSGNIDVAVMKFNTSTTGPGARAWATYLGGSQLEFPHSLLVNPKGELLLLGSTSSANYPTTAGALNRTFRGGPSVSPFGGNSPFVMTTGADLVLSRLSASGGRLRASTYLGGTSTDGLLDAAAPTPRLRHNYGDAFRGDLALDAQGNVYLASVTTSTDFPGLAAGSYRGGPSDALVASLDSSLSQVRWATLLGGAGADAAYSLQREDTGGLLVAGGTTSAALAGATGGYRAAPGGDVDGFVARLSAAGVLAQATYLGTSAYDQAYFVRSAPGGLLVLGQTLSQAWPGADTARYHTARGQHFIQQLASDLRSAGYATVFGSGRTTTDLSPTAFGVDCYGRIGVAGWGGGLDPNGGNTTGLATTPNALQRTTDGQDFYLMQLSDGARVLDYATYFGTSADDHVDGGSSRFDANLTLFQAMCACDQPGGQSIPLPPGATTYMPHNGAAHCNNAAFKFAITAGTSPAGADTLSLCAQARPVRLSGSPGGGVWTGPGVTGSVTAGYYFTPAQTLVGTQVLTYTSPPAANGCAGVSTRRITVLSQPAARITAAQTTFCLDAGVPLPAVLLTGTPAGGTFRGTGVVVGSNGTAVFDPVLAGVGGHFVSYEVSPLGRCPVSAVLSMDVQKVKHADAGPPTYVCLNDPAIRLGGLPAGGTWAGPGVTGSAGVFLFTPTTVGVGGPYLLIYSVPTVLPACPIVSDTLLLTVVPPGGTATVPADTTFCLRNQAVRLTGGLPRGGTWTGPGVTGSATAGFVFTATSALVGKQTLLYTAPPGNNPLCPGRAQRVLTVMSSGQATVSAGTLAVCAVGGPQALQATPAGGTWTGPGITGSVATGFIFTPSVALVGVQTLNYLGPTPANPALCAIAGSLQLQVLAVPTVSFDPIAPINFCLTAPPHGVVLTASPAGGTFSGPGVVANRFDPATTGPGHYVLTYTWNYPNVNCPIVATRAVDVVLVAAPRVPADTVLCTGSRVPFRLRATPAGGTWAGPGVTATGLFTPPATAGTTTLSYTLPDGCGSATYRITVPSQPASAAVRWTVPTCAANDFAPRHLRFEATGLSAAQVQWDFGDGSALAGGAVVEHTYAAVGHYQPVATLGLAGPCSSQLTRLPAVVVEAAQVPNIITPNGDGLNDIFVPELGGCPGRLQVFSRWGQKVFDVAEYHNDWAAAGLPEGLYYYVLDRADASAPVRGWVQVVR